MNNAFDRLCAKQDLANAKRTLENMKAALPTADTATRDYILQAIPMTEKQIAIYTNRLSWGF